MRNQLFSTFIIIFTLSGLTLSTSVQARIKCWTNGEGVKECGNTVPPEFAQKGHQELNNSARVKKEKDRVKTDEEIMEEKRLSKVEAEEKRALKEQKKKDKILLNTFSAVEDIERARDERLTALKAAINLTRARSEKIQYDLDKRIQKAAAAERAGKTPSEALLSDIESLKRQLNNNDTFIEGKQAEQEKITESHAKDIAHFKKLKGIK